MKDKKLNYQHNAMVNCEKCDKQIGSLEYQMHFPNMDEYDPHTPNTMNHPGIVQGQKIVDFLLENHCFFLCNDCLAKVDSKLRNAPSDDYEENWLKKHGYDQAK